MGCLWSKIYVQIYVVMQSIIKVLHANSSLKSQLITYAYTYLLRKFEFPILTKELTKYQVSRQSILN